MQEFFILKDSTNPYLEMELIDSGRYNFNDSVINYALQDSQVTFTMINEETNTPKISKAKANIIQVNNNSCEEKFILQYKWKPRDVNESGVFKGVFEITFNNNLYIENIDLPSGNLKVPIEEDLVIIIK